MQDSQTYYAGLIDGGNCGGVSPATELATKMGGGNSKDISFLKEYRNSNYSKAKETIIRDLAESLSDIMQMDKNYVKNSSLSKIVDEHMAKSIPDPDNGKIIKTNKDIHTGVINGIKNAISKYNKTITGGCNDNECLNECLNTMILLVTGLNMEISDASEIIDAESEGLSDESKKLLMELKSSVIEPSKNSLKDLTIEIPDCDVSVGSKKCSIKLSHIIKGMHTIAKTALTVDNALITLSDRLQNYSPATEGDTSVVGGVGVSEGMGFADMVSDSLYDPQESLFKGRVHANRNSIGEELHKKDMYRRKMFESLNKQIRNSYDAITMDLYKVGKKIGSEIPVSDKLHTFIRQLGYFSGVQPDRKNLYKALSGYRRDVNSEYIKHDFMRALESIESASNSMTTGTGGAHFKSLYTSLARLIKIVDNFNETFTKTLTSDHIKFSKPEVSGAGPDEEDVNLAEVDDNLDNVDDKPVGGSNTSSAITALGNAENILGGNADFKYLVTMKKAIREIEYYFKIANIKSSLKIASSHKNNYTKNYNDILGEECGMLIDKINSKFKLLTCETYTGDLPIQKEMKADKTLGDSTYGNTPCLAYQNLKKFGTEKKTWKAYVFLMEYIRSAKVEMIEAAQALDLYLSAFTEHIQSNPNDVKDFLKLLEQIEIVSKWFTDKSGDNLVCVFEASEDGLFKIDGTGDNTMKKTDHYYKQLGKKDPADFRNGVKIIDIEYMKDFMIRLEKSFKSMRALENIIATFTKINNKVGGEVKAIMSPGLIFKSFMKYSVATSIAIGKTKITSTNTTDRLYKSSTFLDFITTVSQSDLRVYLRPVHNIFDNDTLENQHYFDPLHIGDEINDRNTYIQTDEIFEMCIKSMITKVFTVVGAYSLFQRPPKDYSSNKSISNTPLRQIMGGGNQYTKVIPEATELYIRLTLLGEWYRDLFNFKETKPDDNGIIVSMIPSFDGIWSRFVNVIFVDASNINDGGYTETFSKELIESINDIYNHYKSKYGSNICMKILENFVAEVNSRYGMVKQTEITAYLKQKEKGLNTDEYEGENDNVDYDILDSKSQITRKPVPSDKFTKAGYKNVKHSELANKKFYDEIKTFRMAVEENLKLDSTFDDKLMNKNSNYSDNFGVLGLQYASVDDLIRQTAKRVKSTDDDEKKYNIIQSTVMGVERYSDIDYDVMLMFHETVINPLTILFTVYKMINNWNRFANSLNVESTNDSPDEQDFKDALKNISGNKKYRDDNHKYLWLDSNEYRRYTGNSEESKNHLMEDTINHLFYMICDKNPMVEMYFSGNGTNRYPMLSFKQLEKCTLDLVSCVESSLVKFRKLLPYEIIKKYDDNHQNDFTLNDTTPTNPNVVSLFYIKEHLVDRLIKNKYGAGLSTSNDALKNIWLRLTKKDEDDEPLQSYKKVFSKLIYWDSESDSKPRFESRGVNDNWSKFPINKIGLHKVSTITGDAINQMGKIMIEGTGFKGNVHQAIRTNQKGKESLLDSANMGHKCIYDYDTLACGSDKKNSIQYDDEGHKDGGSEGALGLVFKFNRLLYHYINLFTDVSSNKIYLPLLEKFANGVAAGEVMKGNSIDDISTYNQYAVFPSFEIGSKSAIFATMALAIKNIVTNKKQISSANILNFSETNLLNVSDYMKDLMNAYLPIFDKHLNIICSKSDLFKTLIEQTRVSVKGNVAGAEDTTYKQVKDDGVADSLKTPRVGNESDSKSQLIDMLAHLHACARSLQKCVKDTSKELADMPLYFETYQNSITDYKNRNGVLPLMPLSHVSHLLNNQTRLVRGLDKITDMSSKYGGSLERKDRLVYRSCSGLIPHCDVGVGSDEFKFAYGTRGLLSDSSEPNIDLAPGVLGVLDTYNSKVGGAMSYDKKKVVDCFEHSTRLLRFATDYTYHKTYLGDQNLDKLTDFFIVGTKEMTQNIEKYTDQNVLQHLSCQTGRHMKNHKSLRDGILETNDPFFINSTNITLLIDNDNYKQSVYRMLRCIVDNQLSEHMHYGDRRSMRIYNILDANIVPINFHALQREIPLVNIYNYSYTFDQLMNEYLGIEHRNKTIKEIINVIDGDKARDANKFPADTLVQMLIAPTGFRGVNEYVNNIWSLMAGFDGLTLNTPKYLSDQLWNKVLLNSLHTIEGDRGNQQDTPVPTYNNNNNALSLSFGIPRGSTRPEFLLDGYRGDDNIFLNHHDQITYQLPKNRSDNKHSLNLEKADGNAVKMTKTGYIRYQTIAVRYIEWFVHLQRVMRLLMRDQLTWVNDPIVHKSNAINSQVTEFYSNDKFDVSEFE